MGTGFHGGLSMLVMERRRAGNKANVYARVDHVAVVLAGELEPPVGFHLLEQFRALSRHGHEFDVFATFREIRQV